MNKVTTTAFGGTGNDTGYLPSFSLQPEACPVSDRAAGGSRRGWGISFTHLCFAENTKSRLSVWIWGWDLDPRVPLLEQTVGFYWLVRSNSVNIMQLFTDLYLFFPNVVVISSLRVVLFHKMYAVTLKIQKITCILQNLTFYKITGEFESRMNPVNDSSYRKSTSSLLFYGKKCDVKNDDKKRN